MLMRSSHYSMNLEILSLKQECAFHIKVTAAYIRKKG